MMAPAAGGTDYAVETADPAGLREAVLAVWRSTLGHVERHAPKFDWFYRDAPDPALLQVLLHGPDREVVGTAGVGWRRMRIAGRELRAGVLADMAVHARHRMLGPALLLQRAACDAALEQGDLVYGFPNPNAVPVVKRLGYRHFGDMVLYVRALRIAPYLACRMPRALAEPLGWLADRAIALHDCVRNFHRARLHVTWRDAPDETIHDAPAPPIALLQGERSHAALEWRFKDCPLAGFRFLYLRRSGEGRPHAWFVCQRDADAMRIADFRIEEGPGTPCIAALAAAARAEGCHSLTIECCLPEKEAALFRANGFFERQRRPIYGRWKDPGHAGAEVRMTAFDEDE